MDHFSDTSAEELAGRVGRLVSTQRKSQGLSQAALAERSGLSRTILAKIEQGDGNPSIGTLWRISRALSVPLGDLLGEPVAPRTKVIRAGSGDAVGDPSGMVARLIHGDARERRTELFSIDLPAGARRESGAHAHGVEEVIVITRGAAEVGPDAGGATGGAGLARDAGPGAGAGAGAETLRAGDAMWFASDVAHHYATVGKTDCHLLCWMLYPPVAG